VTASDLKDLAEAAQAALATLAILVGGGWAVRKYLFQKESLARLELRVNVEFVGKQGDEWLVELLGLLENKGAVPHEIRDLKFELRCLLKGDALQEGGATIQKQVNFARLHKEGSWTPGGQDSKMTILPGVAIRYSHVARLPPDAAFVLLHGKLQYNSKKMPDLRADRLLKVPEEREAESERRGRRERDDCGS
jgi:hypothetical protein